MQHVPYHDYLLNNLGKSHWRSPVACRPSPYQASTPDYSPGTPARIHEREAVPEMASCVNPQATECRIPPISTPQEESWPHRLADETQIDEHCGETNMI